MSVPDSKCGFGSDSKTSQACCYRPEWNNSGRCIWHAPEENKDEDALIESRTEHPEWLSGACLENLEFRNSIDFSGCELSEGSFAGSIFSNIDFSQAVLEEADFSNSVLSGADFSGAILHSADLSESILDDANFNSASMFASDISSAQVQQTDFSNANLHLANLSQLDLRDQQYVRSTMYLQGHSFAMREPNIGIYNINFQSSNLHQANLTGSVLWDADFSGANLSNADFSKSDLYGSNFSGVEAPNSDFSDATLDLAIFEDANLNHANLKEVALGEANLKRSNLFHADLTGADLRGADLQHTKMMGTQIIDSFCAHASFSHANLSGIDFSKSDLRRTEFQQSLAFSGNFSEVDLRHSDLRGANFEDASLINADLRGTNLSMAGFHQTYISGVRINGFTEFGTTSIYEKYADILPDVGVDPLEAAIWTYRRLETLYEGNAMSEEASFYHIQKEETRRKYHFRRKKYPQWLVATIDKYLTNYGESIQRLLLSWLVTITFFAILYPLGSGFRSSSTGEVYRLSISLPTTMGQLVEAISILLQSLYFSAITFTTIGYGDLNPTGAMTKGLVGIESLLGGILIALFVYVIARRASR